jgi:hypothetical protein
MKIRKSKLSYLVIHLLYTKEKDIVRIGLRRNGQNDRVEEWIAF